MLQDEEFLSEKVEATDKSCFVVIFCNIFFLNGLVF